MIYSHWPEVCDRLRIRLTHPSLNRFELIDMATVLLLAKADLDQDTAHGTSLDAVSQPLERICDNAQDASIADLHSHVAAACAATEMLARGAPESHSDGSPLADWENIRA